MRKYGKYCDKLNCEYVEHVIVDGLKLFIGKKKAVVGISGGIDSALIAALCVKAVGKDNVVGVQMPYGDQSTNDGSILMNHLGIEDGGINIKPIVDAFTGQISNLLDENRLVNGNIRARTRMTLLYAFAGSCGGYVIGTGNKTELMLGYYTKFGDGGCDIEPIGNLYKTEVFELARYMKLPQRLIDKAPSAELWEGQTDEKEIGMTYEEMDGILKMMETEMQFFDKESIIAKYGDKKLDIILQKIDSSAHKRVMPKSILL